MLHPERNSQQFPKLCPAFQRDAHRTRIVVREPASQVFEIVYKSRNPAPPPSGAAVQSGRGIEPLVSSGQRRVISLPGWEAQYDLRTTNSGSIAISETYFILPSIRSSKVRAAISPILCKGCLTVVRGGLI